MLRDNFNINNKLKESKSSRKLKIFGKMKKNMKQQNFLEKLENDPEGIFHLAVFQKNRDIYFTKLIKEEDKITDKYKIKKYPKFNVV